ncbi:MAG: CBS domain-containing protein [Coriobacteriia bacterium]|nr:CBS domain-containing protein [Coriobacteriia bacterium]
MFDVPSIRLGKIFGIPFEINLSWTIIFTLVAFTLSSGYYPAIPAAHGAPSWLYALVGVTTTVLFFGSVLAHELSHSLVTRAQGGSVDKITLFVFGGVAQISEEPATPGKEFFMASAGPLSSLIIAGLCYLGYVIAIARGAAWWAWAPLQYLATINLFLGAFNLLPGFPLDGGRVFRSAVWAVTGDSSKATRWAARSGQAIGWAMATVAALMVLGGRTDFIWFGLVGWFIAWLAGASYSEQQLKTRIADAVVGKVMSPNPDYVLGEISVEALVQEHLLGRRHSRYPVMHGGEIVGVVSLADVKSVARVDWPRVSVIDITNRNLAKLSVSVNTPIVSVLGRLAGESPGALLVVRDGHLAGIVTRSDVLRLVQSTDV